MPVEAASGWWKEARRREMGGADLDQAVGYLLALGVEWVPTAPLLTRAARMAAEIDHPVYDCVYLVLSASRDAGLATADDRLRRAARGLRVRLWAP